MAKFKKNSVGGVQSHFKFSEIQSVVTLLPDLCEAAGLKRKTAHCLRVTCASSLFNAGVEEKLIRERTGHRSNALLKYEKPSEENKEKVSYLLSPNVLPKGKLVNKRMKSH